VKPEILRTLLGPPIAFNRSLVPLVGSVHAALMLSQALYWSDKTKDPEAWFWKSQDEWTEETGLSRREQETARKQLQGTGFWGERYDRYKHRQLYRVDMGALAGALSRHFDEWRKAPFANGGNVPSRMAESAIGSTSETTSHRLQYPPTPLPEKPGDPENPTAKTAPQEARGLTIPPGAILPANGNDPWKGVKAELRKSLNPRSWESWIRPTRLAYTLDGKVFVAVPSGEFGDWIQENFMPAIAAAKQALGLEFSGIEFVEGARGT